MDFAKLTVEEFKLMMVVCSYDSILHCGRINGQWIHISSQFILDQIEKENYSNLVELSLPTFYIRFDKPVPMHGISGRWKYTYQDGYFVRIKREGRCS